jgi:predicted nuclease of predicted toxin-antitoxin system
LSIRILADENVNYEIIKTLRRYGFEVVSVAENSPGITDFEVIELAVKLNAVVLTEDSDFGRLVFSCGNRINGVIYLRYSAGESKEVAKTLIEFLKVQRELCGKFVVVTLKKVRIRSI